MFLKRIIILCLLTYNAFCKPNKFALDFITEDGSAINCMNTAISHMNIPITPMGRLWMDWVDIRVSHVHQNDTMFNVMKKTCDILNNHTMGIITGPLSKNNLDIIKSMCSARNIPHIFTDWAGPMEKMNQINFYPSMDLLSNAYLDIISNMEWNEFVIISTPSDRFRLEKFLELAENANFIVYIVYFNLHSPELLRYSVESLQKSGVKSFVIDMPESDFYKILPIFGEIGMTTEDYNYFLTVFGPNSDEPEFLKYKNVQFTRIGLVTFNETQSECRECISDWSALYYDIIKILSDTIKRYGISNANITCENGTWDQGTELINYMIETSDTELTRSITFGPDKYRNTFQLYINRTVEGRMEKIGIWDSTYGLDLFENKTDHIIVATVLNEPFTMEKDSSQHLEGNDRFEGYAIDLIEEISKLVHFTYTIILNHKGAHALIQDVMENKSDLAVSDITITSDRLEKVDFTHPFMHSGITILFQKPMAVPPLYPFATPFSNDLWGAIAVAFVTVTLSLFVIGRLSQSEWHRPCPRSNYTVSNLTFINAIWFTAGSIFRQNTLVKIRSVPGIIAAAVWCLFCFIVVATYIAGLIAFKVNDKASYQFTDIQSLVSNSEIKYGTKMHGAVHDFFKNCDEPLCQEIYQHTLTQPEDMVRDTHTGVMRAESSRYAFIGDDVMFDYVIKRHCSLKKYGGLLNERAFGIATRKDSKYLKSLDRAILQLSTSGKLEILKRKWWDEKRGGNTCSEGPTEEEVTALSVTDIGSLIFILLIGVMVATISGVVEFLLNVYALSKKYKVGILRVLSYEVRRSFSRNIKRTTISEFITQPRHEDENDIFELSS